MAYIVAGILLGVLLWVLTTLVVVPHVLYVLGLIVAVILVLYGLWVLLMGGPRGGPPVDGRRRRVWY